MAILLSDSEPNRPVTPTGRGRHMQKARSHGSLNLVVAGLLVAPLVTIAILRQEAAPQAVATQGALAKPPETVPPAVPAHVQQAEKWKASKRMPVVDPRTGKTAGYMDSARLGEPMPPVYPDETSETIIGYMVQGKGYVDKDTAEARGYSPTNLPPPITAPLPPSLTSLPPEGNPGPLPARE